MKNVNNHRQKSFDIALNWALTTTCNLRCRYCLSGSLRPSLASKLGRVLDFCSRNFFARRAQSSIIKKNDIDRIVSSLDKSGRIYEVTLSGGEPFCSPDFMPLCSALTRNHFLGVVSNLTFSAGVRAFSEMILPDRVTVIDASLHFKELERCNLSSLFIDNFLLLKSRNFNVRVWAVAYPEYIDEIDKYRQFYISKGIGFTLRPFVGWYRGRFYPSGYSAKEIAILALDSGDLTAFFRKGQLCNAGYNAFYIGENGSVFPCSRFAALPGPAEPFGNISSEIIFRTELMHCPFDLCTCPFPHYNKDLFYKALRGAGIRV